MLMLTEREVTRRIVVLIIHERKKIIRIMDRIIRMIKMLVVPKRSVDSDQPGGSVSRERANFLVFAFVYNGAINGSVSKAIVAGEYPLCNIFGDLQDVHTFAPLRPQIKQILPQHVFEKYVGK